MILAMTIIKTIVIVTDLNVKEVTKRQQKGIT